MGRDLRDIFVTFLIICEKHYKVQLKINVSFGSTVVLVNSALSVGLVEWEKIVQKEGD